jgi:hypothetical protein
MKLIIFLFSFLFLFSFVSAECTSNSYTYGNAVSSPKLCYDLEDWVFSPFDYISLSCSPNEARLFIFSDTASCNDEGCSGIEVENHFEYYPNEFDSPLNPVCYHYDVYSYNVQSYERGEIMLDGNVCNAFSCESNYGDNFDWAWSSAGFTFPKLNFVDCEDLDTNCLGSYYYECVGGRFVELGEIEGECGHLPPEPSVFEVSYLGVKSTIKGVSHKFSYYLKYGKRRLAYVLSRFGVGSFVNSPNCFNQTGLGFAGSCDLLSVSSYGGGK